jgi:hypothetical protein
MDTGGSSSWAGTVVSGRHMDDLGEILGAFDQPTEAGILDCVPLFPGFGITELGELTLWHVQVGGNGSNVGMTLRTNLFTDGTILSMDTASDSLIHAPEFTSWKWPSAMEIATRYLDFTAELGDVSSFQVIIGFFEESPELSTVRADRLTSVRNMIRAWCTSDGGIYKVRLVKY